MPSLRLKSIKVTPGIYFQLEEEKQYHHCRSFSETIRLVLEDHKHKNGRSP